jgi:hypothetical protein
MPDLVIIHRTSNASRDLQILEIHSDLGRLIAPVNTLTSVDWSAMCKLSAGISNTFSSCLFHECCARQEYECCISGKELNLLFNIHICSLNLERNFEAIHEFFSIFLASCSVLQNPEARSLEVFVLFLMHIPVLFDATPDKRSTVNVPS